MLRDPRALLWDVADAAGAIADFVEGRNLSDYLADRMIRSAVERQSIIVGEALNRLSKIDPVLAGRIPELPRVVAFRNLLAHGYADVDHESVWRTVTEYRPGLTRRVEALRLELDAQS
ncbi:DUF86 domain-containing protein [Stella sp.]|uniref:HepT-like ribonuclease domain-containing protein n=1 Tax=Stella sp. TaxID=2912054 RepID=UPI0035B278D2